MVGSRSAFVGFWLGACACAFAACVGDDPEASFGLPDASGDATAPREDATATPAADAADSSAPAATCPFVTDGTKVLLCEPFDAPEFLAWNPETSEGAVTATSESAFAGGALLATTNAKTAAIPPHAWLSRDFAAGQGQPLRVALQLRLDRPELGAADPDAALAEYQVRLVRVRIPGAAPPVPAAEVSVVLVYVPGDGENADYTQLGLRIAADGTELRSDERIPIALGTYVGLSLDLTFAFGGVSASLRVGGQPGPTLNAVSVVPDGGVPGSTYPLALGLEPVNDSTGAEAAHPAWQARFDNLAVTTEP